MPWNKALVVMAITLLFGIICGRVLMPLFRKLKTGKFDWYIGDRFNNDGSEPLFGGIAIFLPLCLGTMLGIGSVRQDIGMDGGLKILAALVLCLMLMLIGCAEDYNHDVKGSVVGIKLSRKIAVEFLLCLTFLLFLRTFCGDKTTVVLLPFRLGYVNFGLIYYPITALGMTAVVKAVKLHDCFGYDTKSSVDGLCTLSMLICSLFFAVYGSICNDVYLSCFGYASAAACAGFLVWNISPSKMLCGQSGGLMLGGVLVAMAVVSKLHLLVFMAGAGFLIDGICTLVQYAVFRKSKRLVFKGSSLHAHLRAKNYSDYKIMLIFLAIDIVGGISGAVFVIYSTKIV